MTSKKKLKIQATSQVREVMFYPSRITECSDHSTHKIKLSVLHRITEAQEPIQ